MKSFVRYILLSVALILAGCHGVVNELDTDRLPSDNPDKPTVEKGLVIAVDKTTIEANGEDFVTFSLKLDGQELTSSDSTLANIYFKHEKSGTRLERYATTFSAVKNGDYSFVATYKGQQSKNSVQIKAVNREKYEPYGQKIMVYDLTGAWCPNCPSMTAGLENVDEMWKDNMIVLAVHNGDQWAIPAGNSDLAQMMLGQFGGVGYPSCIYDLQYLNGNARTPSEIGKILEEHLRDYPATCGVKISSTKLEGKRLTIDAAMTSSVAAEYELGYAVIVDNQYYSGGTAIDGIYNDIVVAVSENFNTMTDTKFAAKAKEEVTKSFVVENLAYTDPSVMRIVVFALTKQNGKVMVDNANVCSVGKSAPYNTVGYFDGLPEDKLTLTADKTTIKADGSDAVTFTVKCGSEDVSNARTMNIIRTFNGEEIELKAGVNSFTTTVAGEYTFKARYYKGGDMFSESISVTATDAAAGGTTNFRHKLLGMQFTSVGCPNCPTLSTVIKAIEAEQPNRLVPVSFHLDYNISDPMKIAIGDTYYKTLKGNGLPMFYLDLRDCEEMTSNKSVIETEMAKIVADYKPTCGVAITTSYDQQSGTLTITPRIKSNIETQYRYLIMLVEDGIEAAQYGVSGGSYTHNNVVRAVLSDNIYGSRFNNGAVLEIGVDTPLSKAVTTTIKSSWRAENMRVVVSALSTFDGGTTYYCNNTNSCKLGESTDYALEGEEGSGDNNTPAGNSFNKHVAVFEFTGAWCSQCPQGYTFLKYLIEDYYSHNTVHILAFHDSTGGADPMGMALTNTLFKKFKLDGYPGFVVDMREGTSEKTAIQAMIESSFSSYPATCGVKLSSQCASGKGTVTAEVCADAAGTYRLALYIIEDGIVAKQNSGGVYKDDYVHNHVVRALLSSLYEGDRVGALKSGEKKSLSYNFTLDSSWVAENCTLCALVIDSNGYVNNMAVCPLNGTKDYDYKK